MRFKNVRERKSLLRFTTAGSADDGKSTLIGRLLYESKSILEDQLEQIVRSSKRLGRENIDLSLLTDGLRAEREQGITIDVAYRHFSSPSRRFIIADTPGHVQFTRNMVTGASTADLAVILVDARNGMREQTIRHSYIATLLDIKHIIFCINKMDLIEYSESVFLKIKSDLSRLGEKLNIRDVHFIPISAKDGDNVVVSSENMRWYRGKTFLNLIETIVILKDQKTQKPRFPVQMVIRSDSSEDRDFRGYAGRIAGGALHAGDEVIVLPSRIKSRITGIDNSGASLTKASSGDSVCLLLKDPVDINRGDLIVRSGELPRSGQDITLMVCWLHEQPLKTGERYLIRINTNETSCIIQSVNFKINMETLEKNTTDREIRMNDISNISIHTAKTLYFDTYKNNHVTGSLIFIDEGTNETVGAGMIV